MAEAPNTWYRLDGSYYEDKPIVFIGRVLPNKVEWYEWTTLDDERLAGMKETRYD